MNYRRLPKTDLNLSEIGFGCMSLNVQSSGNIELIHRAIDGGINYFDTADLYDKGENEALLGRALQGKRQEVTIATKVGNELKSDGNGWDWNPSKDYILKAVDKSLARLKTDYIDIYQLHGGTLEDAMDEVVEAFEVLKEKGKIRHYGISSIRPNVIREYVASSNIVNVMMQYSLLDRRPEEEVMDLLHKNSIGLVVRGALAKGVLAGKTISDYLDYDRQSVDLLVIKLKAFSNEKRPMSHLALQWVLSHKQVTSIALGIRTMDQLEEALAYQQSSPLSVNEIEELSTILEPNTYTAHR